MDIYNILASKPHNPHYLNRYIRFVTRCQEKNADYIGYTEKHHICPKASDMFPEYKCFKENPWNCAVLTARQHFIAHVILSKVYKSYSMISAAWAMQNKNNIKINSKIYEILKTNFSLFSSSIQNKIATLKNYNGDVIKVSSDETQIYKNNGFYGLSKNKVTVKDEDGNTFQVDKNDPEYLNGNIVPFMKGKMFVSTEESEVSFMIDTIDYDKNIHKFHRKGKIIVKNENNETFSVCTTDERYKSGELLPIHTGIAYGRTIEGELIATSKADERFFTGELSGNNKGKFWITNGYNNMMIDDSKMIPEGYYRGKTQKENSKTTKGTIFINNGIKTKRIKKNQPIPEGWRKGMLNNKSKPFKYITDGYTTRKISPEDEIPKGFYYGMAPRKKKAVI
jgi:hypothetical protein